MERARRDLARDDRGRRRLRDRPARHAQGGVPPRQRVPRLHDDRRPRPASSASSNRTGWPSRPTARRRLAGRPRCSTGPRSTASRGGQVGDTGTIRGEGFALPGRRHEEGQRLHAPRRPGRPRGPVTRQRHGRRPRSTPTAARRSAAPTRRRTSCTTPCTRTWASTPSRPAARSSPTGSGSTSPTPRPSAASGSARSRRRSTSGSSSGEPVTWSMMPIERGQGAGRDGPVRREVPRDRPRRADGRVLARALRRDPPRQHRPGRPVQDRRRGVGRGRHPPDHRPDGQGGARPRPPGGGDPRRGRRRAEGPAGAGRPSGSRPCSRRSRRSRSRPRQRRPRPAAKVSADDLLAAADDGRRGQRRDPRRRRDATPDELRQLDRRPAPQAPARLAVLLATVGRRQGPPRRRPDPRPDRRRACTPGNWLKEVAPVVGGGGGGRPDLAQAGGKDPDKIPAALERALEFLKAKLDG